MQAFSQNAKYQRLGPNLIVSEKNGTQLLIKNYFDATEKPTLISPDGKQAVDADLVNSFLITASPKQYAQIGNTVSNTSAEPIGVVAELKGTVFAVRTDGTRVNLKKGDSVFQGDVIETEKDSAANMLLADKTTFAIGDEARLALDEMVYNPASQEGQSQFSILKGVFVFTSGEIAKTDSSKMTVNTPVATIGIRGTEVSGSVSDEGAQITVLDGTVTVTTNAGTATLGSQGETTLSQTLIQHRVPPSLLLQPSFKRPTEVFLVFRAGLNLTAPLVILTILQKIATQTMRRKEILVKKVVRKTLAGAKIPRKRVIQAVTKKARLTKKPKLNQK